MSRRLTALVLSLVVLGGWTAVVGPSVSAVGAVVRASSVTGALAPGQVEYLVNGDEVPFDDTDWTAYSRALELAVFLRNGDRVGFDLAGVTPPGTRSKLDKTGKSETIVVTPGGRVRLDRIYGFRGQVRVLLDDARIGAVRVVRGTRSAEVAAPEGLSAGRATLGVTGKAAGASVTFRLGVVVRLAQRPATPVPLPSRLEDSGWTTLLPGPVVTNAGQNLSVVVRCREPGLRFYSNSGLCQVERTPDGAVRLWLPGTQDTAVRVALVAPESGEYGAYRSLTSYRTSAVG